MTRIFRSDFRDDMGIDRPDPLPVHTLDRVERPTSFIDDEKVKRVDERDGGYIACILADYIRRLGYPARAMLF